MYNDKLILWNEGRLPENFTIETLLGKHPSRPFNKNIADIFFKAGFIEAWGRGIAKIINGFTTAGLATPIFAVAMGGIMITIHRNSFIQDLNTEQIREGLSEGLSEGLNEGLRTLFIIIQKNPGVQAKDLPDLLNSRPLKTIERQLSQLMKQNFIKREGSRKTGGYIALKTLEDLS